MSTHELGPLPEPEGGSKQEFDAAGFYSALERSVRARKVAWKDVAAATGVSQTTLSRMRQGRRPDAASLAALSAWAGINPANYVPKPRHRGAAQADAQPERQLTPLPPSPVEVCDLILQPREHVQSLGWRNREALYPAHQVSAYTRAEVARAVAAERERCAVAAWNHYVATCEKTNRRMSLWHEFCAANAIREGAR